LFILESLNMPLHEQHRDHLYGLLALQMDFVSRDGLRRALAEHDANPSRRLGQILIEHGSLASSRADLLTTLVDEHLRVHSSASAIPAGNEFATISDDGPLSPQGDVRSALEQLLSGLPPAVDDAELGTIVDPDLAKTFDRSSPPPEATIQDQDFGTIVGGSYESSNTLIPPAPSFGSAFNPGSSNEGSIQGATKGTPPRPAPQALRFTILKHHAKGGLGDVFVARDEELHRLVALKEIQEKHADRHDSRYRFLLEAEITGGLEHPGIVPVYGMGQYPDGRPFYAMRFISGDDLRNFIDKFHTAEEDPNRDPGERTLAFREMIGCLIDTCNAIGYAHSRGVLHRDIKPGNIMIGKYGETLVVDWGLAKTVDHPDIVSNADEKPLLPSSHGSSTPTMMGSTIGTLQYMSPEQASGKLDELGPAADIYSLGATLYSVLTGSTAFPDPTPSLVLHKVKTGDFKAPREINEKVPLALNAICLKAMSLHQSDRYKTTMELADDLQHWLADEPVSAYAEPWHKRFERWARRHRQAVIGAAAVVATVIVGLILSNVLISREQKRTLAAKIEAQNNYRIAREAVEKTLDEVGAIDLAEVPLMEASRKKMLILARQFYEKFLATQSHDPDLRFDIIQANVRLGEVQEMLGEAKPAIESFNSALSELKSLKPEQLADPKFQRLKAAANFGLGLIFKKSNRFRDGEDALNEALKTRDAILSQTATDNDKREAALTLYHLGALIGRKKNREADAAAIYKRALDAQQTLLDTTKGQVAIESRRDFARNLNNTGILLGDDAPGKALPLFREAYTTATDLEKQFPDSPLYRWQAARAASNLGITLNRTAPDNPAAFTDMFDQALKRFRRLSDEFPKIPDYRQELAAVESVLSQISLDDVYQGVENRAASLAKASALAEDAVAQRSILVRDFPLRPDYSQGLSRSLRQQAEVLRIAADTTIGPKGITDEGHKQLALAKQKIDRAIDNQQALLKEYPEARDFDLELARSLHEAGTIARHANQIPDAEKYFREAVDLTAKCLDLDPKSNRLRRELGEQTQDLALALLDLDRDNDGLKAIDDRLKTLGEDPSFLSLAARTYAILVDKSSRRSNLSADEKSRIEDQATRAIALLRQAFERGFADPAEFAQPAYKSFLSRDDFKQLEQEIRNKAKAKVG
jgi:serine/threonine-protein kinase